MFLSFVGCKMFRHIYTHSFSSSQDAITEMARKALHRVDCQDLSGFVSVRSDDPMFDFFFATGCSLQIP